MTTYYLRKTGQDRGWVVVLDPDSSFLAAVCQFVVTTKHDPPFTANQALGLAATRSLILDSSGQTVQEYHVSPGPSLAGRLKPHAAWVPTPPQ